jgi:hypothetical protein
MARLDQLPLDIITIIFEGLSLQTQDLCNTRLTCRDLYFKVHRTFVKRYF